jgi:hypothetical protein
MNFELFGFKIGEKLGEDSQDIPSSFSSPNNMDGAAEKIISNAPGGFNVATFDLDKSVAKVEELINSYRTVATHPTLDNAISEIVNEAIVYDSNEPVARLDLDDSSFSASVKKKIQAEWEYIYGPLLNLSTTGADIFRQWYIEGVLYGHKIIDEKSPKKGILQVNILDATKIKKIREIKKQTKAGIDYVTEVIEYFVYNSEGLKGKSVALKIHPEMIAMATSGNIDQENQAAISYIAKAIRPLNMLKYAEDAQLIYRISRAPERRVFYIDVGMMGGSKAEEYVRKIMDKFRNKMVYDSNTGEMKSTKNYQAFTEDYWLPRREGGKGTEVSTLPGGTNLSQIEDILFFQQSLYKSLNVPLTRLESENAFNLGRASEITREEIKFAKFIFNIRNRFSQFLLDLVKTQLILKNIITLEDWAENLGKIKIKYNKDSYYDELKRIEVMKEKLEYLGSVDAFVGKYFSKDFVFKEVLNLTDEEIEEMLKQIEKELDEDPSMESEDGSGDSDKSGDQQQKNSPQKVDEEEDDKTGEKPKQLNKSKE